MNYQPPNQHYIYLHALLSCSLIVELIDMLEGTQHYKGTIKNKAQALLTSICPVVDHDMLMLCRKVNGKGITNLMTDQENLMIEISKHYISDFRILSGILEKFREDPAFVLNQLKITVITEPEPITEQKTTGNEQD